VTAVEFALVLPILLIFVFGEFEFARVNMLRNTMENAAFEGGEAVLLLVLPPMTRRPLPKTYLICCESMTRPL